MPDAKTYRKAKIGEIPCWRCWNYHTGYQDEKYHGRGRCHDHHYYSSAVGKNHTCSLAVLSKAFASDKPEELHGKDGAWWTI